MKNDDGNIIVWETENFMVVVPIEPFISREEGGHLMIMGNGDKYRYSSRLDFTPTEILEVQRLCQMVCSAFVTAMKKQGINIIRINYFEAGNWAFKPEFMMDNKIKPFYHEHIFGRVVDAKKQVFPEAPYLPNRNTGFYDDFVPLTDDDINLIIEEMKKLEFDDKYNMNDWIINNV